MSFVARGNREGQQVVLRRHNTWDSGLGIPRGRAQPKVRPDLSRQDAQMVTMVRDREMSEGTGGRRCPGTTLES